MQHQTVYVDKPHQDVKHINYRALISFFRLQFLFADHNHHGKDEIARTVDLGTLL